VIQTLLNNYGAGSTEHYRPRGRKFILSPIRKREGVSYTRGGGGRSAGGGYPVLISNAPLREKVVE